MGTTVDIRLWSILNHSTANRDISLTCGSICLASSLIFMHLQLLLPLTSSSMITSQRRWALWKSRMNTSATSSQTKTWDVFVNMAQNTGSCRWCWCLPCISLPCPSPSFVKLSWNLVQEQFEMYKCKSAGKKNWTTGEYDIYICCCVVQNRPKVVDNYSSTHFYFRYVKL